MEAAGIVALLIFFLVLFGSIKGWIPQNILPMQSSLILAALLITAVGLVLGHSINPDQVVTLTSLHPVTATIAGFILAGAIKSAGGFTAASGLISRLTKTSLGLPFAIILLVNIPTIFAMPCGRVWVSPLVPVALMLGYEAAKEKSDRVLPVMVVFGLVVNAAASCGPSVIGGIGVIGEGMGRFPSGSFSDHHQVAIMLITLITMALVKVVYRTEAPPDLILENDAGSEVPEHGYFSIIVFITGIALTVIFRPAIPLQAILLVMTLLIMAVARLSIRDLVEGIMLHPLTAMISGFIMAGVLSVFGGFDVLTAFLDYAAQHTPLGYAGVAILFIYVPVFFPMPCGRIIAVSLIPGVLMFGEHLGEITGSELAQPAMLAAFILAGAASCAPSPLGGIGSIGEGRLRLSRYSSERFLSFGIFFGVPLAAVTVSLLGLGSGNFSMPMAVIAAATGLACGTGINMLTGNRPWHRGGVLGGVLTGMLMMVF